MTMVQEWFSRNVCKVGHVCFLNCSGCEVASWATKDEKAAAAKELREYRKRIGLKP